MNARFFLALLFLPLCHTPFAADISGVHAALKAKGKHHLELTVGAKDQQTMLPMTIITGPTPGPVLLVLAGVHGSEHSPILATQRLASSLSSDELSGAVIIVHIANLPAYLGRTVYTSPVDGKNLNRVFPGKKTGSLTERIAYMLTSELYPLADAVLDMHSGDGNEDLRPYWTGYYARAGDPEVIAKSKAMAYAFGLPYIVPFQWELSDKADAIWAGSAAVALGIPSIDVEAGGMNIPNEDAIAAIEQGMMRTMAHLNMIEAHFEPPKKPTLIIDRQSVKSPTDGSWISLKPAGQHVKKGELLGYVTDWYGRRVFEAHAPIDGILLLRISSPPVRQGETLVVVAR
ncbi:MAG: M14 family metallopeptidase [Pseudomonadota bacterium]